MVSFLYFDGFKIKDDRSPGIAGHPVRRADRDVPPGQRLHRQPAARPVEDRRRPRRSAPNMFLSAKYAYYNTGFILDARWAAWTCRRAATSRPRSRTARSARASNVRPQKSRQRRRSTRSSARWAQRTTSKYGFGFRHRWTRRAARCGRATAFSRIENSPTDLRAQVFRQGIGGNRAELPRLLRRRHDLARTASTIDVGVRYDQQGGKALPSEIAANPAFPNAGARA